MHGSRTSRGPLGSRRGVTCRGADEQRACKGTGRAVLRLASAFLPEVVFSLAVARSFQSFLPSVCGLVIGSM